MEEKNVLQKYEKNASMSMNFDAFCRSEQKEHEQHSFRKYKDAYSIFI